MRPLFAFCLLLATSPLAAQPCELGLMLGTQQNGSYSYQVRFSGGKESLEQNTIRLVRFALRVADFGPVGAQFTLGYQPESQAQTSPSTSSSWSIRQSAVSIGTGFSSDTPLLIGGYLELRSESLQQVPGPNTYDQGGSISCTRAWVRFNLGYTFATVKGKPFIALEFNFPTVTWSADKFSYPNAEERLKALAARRQSGIYVGVRF